MNNVKGKHFTVVDTWLPVFSGFYGTIWETDSMEESEIDHINETRHEKGLLPVKWDDVEWDCKGYQQDVAKGVTFDVIQKLQDLGCIHDGKYQELRSPREYNFANDSINVQFTLSAKNVLNIQKYLKDNEAAFDKYIIDRYSSRSGFISSYSKDFETWVGNNLGDTLDHPHKLGSVLNFILWNEEGQGYEYSLYEHVIGNGAFLTAKNYTELTEALQ